LGDIRIPIKKDGETLRWRDRVTKRQSNKESEGQSVQKETDSHTEQRDTERFRGYTQIPNK
jgi:hypothetical protein